MAGINTLIDTLVHSVLGKRVDIPPPKELNEPVRPLSPADAPQAVRSDSRLEPGRVPVKDMPMPSPRQGAQSPRGDAPQPSIQASFTPAGRAIAEVLARFPSPPSVLTPAAPLVASGETPAPADLAARLQTSISDSGLFYESHLNRWHRGEMTLQQLAREPQMQWQRTLTPAGAGQPGSQLPASLPGEPARPGPPVDTAASARVLAPEVSPRTAPPGAPPAPGVPQTPVSAAPAPETGGFSRSGGEEAARAGDPGDSSRVATTRPDLPDNLQGIVRHQLELLSFPVLRWEGDVWSGLFLALMIQLPGQESRDRGHGEDGGSDRDQDRTWRSELALSVSGLGELKVTIRMLDDQLDLRLAARSRAALDKLESGAADLTARLQQCGFAAPVIRISLLDGPVASEADGEPDHDG